MTNERLIADLRRMRANALRSGRAIDVDYLDAAIAQLEALGAKAPKGDPPYPPKPIDKPFWVLEHPDGSYLKTRGAFIGGSLDPRGVTFTRNIDEALWWPDEPTARSTQWTRVIDPVRRELKPVEHAYVSPPPATGGKACEWCGETIDPAELATLRAALAERDRVIEAFTEALTPSAETKAAYIGEFQDAMESNMPTDFDKQHTFAVEGRGPFPFDMLRHSSAWPYSTADAAQLAGDGRRRVVLTCERFRFLNVKRWESFGWLVVSGVDEHGYPEPVDYTGQDPTP